MSNLESLNDAKSIKSYERTVKKLELRQAMLKGQIEHANKTKQFYNSFTHLLWFLILGVSLVALLSSR